MSQSSLSQQPLDARPAPRQKRDRSLKLPAGARQVESPYLTTAEAALYLRLKSVSAVHYHVKANRLPVLRCGESLRFDKRDLDAWMRQELHLLPSQRTGNRKRSA